MLDRVSPTKVDAWGFKAEFDKVLGKVELLTPSSLSGEGSLRVETEVVRSLRHELDVARPPELLVLRAWARLEAAMRQISDAEHPHVSARVWNRSQPIDQVARELGFDADEISALRELRELRNRIAHTLDVSVSDEEAARYRAATERFLSRLNGGSNKSDGDSASG